MPKGRGRDNYSFKKKRKERVIYGQASFSNLQMADGRRVTPASTTHLSKDVRRDTLGLV